MDALMDLSIKNFYDESVKMPYSVDAAIYYGSLLEHDVEVNDREIAFWFDYTEKVHQQSKFDPKTFDQWRMVMKVWKKFHDSA